MQIEAIHEIDLTPDLEAQIAEVIAAAFGQNADYSGRSFFKQRHSLRIVGRLDGAIMGHIALIFRQIRVGDALVPIIGVAEVATRPEAQGQGIASALLQDAIARSRKTQAEFMLLWGVRPIYSGHGFHNATNDITWVDMQAMRTKGLVTKPARALMYLSLSGKAWDQGAPIDLLGPTF